MASADRQAASIEDKRSVDVDSLRRAFGKFATGVTVVTTATSRGSEPVGVTVNSFSSVSLEPPLLSWCLYEGSRLRASFESSDHFIVNVLAEDQLEVSQAFAGPGENRFAGIEYTDGVASIPRLAGCSAWFECRRHEAHASGDHVIFVGEVLSCSASETRGLAFHEGEYAVTDKHPRVSGDAGGVGRVFNDEFYNEFSFGW